MLHDIILGKGDHDYKYVILDYLSYEWEIKLFCRDIMPFICVIMLLSFDRFDTIHHF